MLLQGSRGADGFTLGKSAVEIDGIGTHEELLNEAELAAAAEEKETHAFEIDPTQVGSLMISSQYLSFLLLLIYSTATGCIPNLHCIGFFKYFVERFV